MVTVTGIGGIDKTRLAVRVASDMLASFSDGVWRGERGKGAPSAPLPKCFRAESVRENQRSVKR